VSEAEPESLIKLREEIEYKRDNMVNLAQMLKENMPNEFKERAQRALQDSAKMAKEGQRKLGDLRARLEFRSFDSEAGSYRGPAPSAGKRSLKVVLSLEFWGEGARVGATRSSVPTDLTALLRGWGQLRANDSGWLVFDGRYASYPRFKKEWVAYRETYHSVVNDNLDATTLKEKCVKGDAHKMICHLEELGEIWDTLDTYYESPEKYMEEALKPVLEFRKYRLFDNGTIREFYSILRAAIKGAKGIGRLDLLINNQTVPKIMGKMPFSDWKEWATKRPEWERKWRDALNVAAAEPQAWEPETARKDRGLPDRSAGNRATGEKPIPSSKGPTKAVGAANVVTQQLP
jgi:hypothetical protein